MINIGGIYLLLQKEIQDHTLFYARPLGLNMYESGICMRHVCISMPETEKRKYNFSRLDICLDFLTQNHIKPYLELGFKPFIYCEVIRIIFLTRT